ncbi:MAG: DNA polymerase III subunit gamma/tau [Patescibacteria group bacterium]
MNQITTSTLYRKYRPHTFDEVRGQEEVVNTLQKQIANESIAHAYLFSGGRGTGKTSIARIFARELGTHDQDIYEIDAASNRGINEIRTLRDGVVNRPFYSPYKVYIIDEVHMLTKEAFNALLKTLEEPPMHAIFILATTEKHKVLDTILSRCQVYDFRLGERDTLAQMVVRVAQEEGYTIDQEAAQYIARKGNGSYRDTLSYLQKILATGKKEISLADIQSIYGGRSESFSFTLIEAIDKKDKEALMVGYSEYIGTHTEGDYQGLLEEMLALTRSVLLLRYDTQYLNQIEHNTTTEKIRSMQDMKNITSHTLRDLLETYNSMLGSSYPQEAFEVFLFSQIEKW